MLAQMSYVDRETRFRHRLDDLIESLTSGDLAQIRLLKLTDGWPPEIENPTDRVEHVLLLLEEARRAELDEHDIAHGTIATLRAHLLARITSPPEEFREIDPLRDAGA